MAARNPEHVGLGLRERKLIAARKYKKAHPERVRAKERKYKAENRDKIKVQMRAAALKRKFGITPKHVSDMLEAQAGKCAVCRTDTPRGRGTWHVDHCHVTGKIRGLLCHDCNVGLGSLRDDEHIVEAALAYLRR